MVLLHALGESSASWDAVRAEFDPFYRVVSIDLRGHGDSDWTSDYSYELMRDDVLGALDQLDLRQITLIGHSLGGVVAYLVAEDQPSRIERLVIEDAVLPYGVQRAVPEQPDIPLPFDWVALTAVFGQSEPDPTWWDRLDAITAPTLLIGGGPDSHIPGDKLEDTASRVPRCTIVTIPAGHYVHDAAPAEFVTAVLKFLR